MLKSIFTLRLVAFIVLSLVVVEGHSQIKVVKPTAGDLLETGSTYKIKWEAGSYISSKASIFLWDAHASEWAPVIRSIPVSQGSINWQVPILNSGDMYRIKMVIDGQSDPSISTAFFRIQGGKSIENDNSTSVNRQPIDSETDASLLISPNPATNTIKVKAEHLDIVSIEIHDVTGNVLQRYFVEGKAIEGWTRIQLDNLSNGTYLLMARFSNGNSLARKLIILK